jgi:hypothetical protein
MSIFRLAAETARDMPAGGGSPDLRGLPSVKRSFVAGVVAPPDDPPGVPFVAPPASAPPAPEQPPAPPPAFDPLVAAMNGLTKFIPAETLTLFVAVTGIIAGWKTPADPQTASFLTAFFIFLALSPLFYVVATIVALRPSGRPFVASPRFVWRFVALMIAFVVWSCAISNDTSLAVLSLFHLSDPYNHVRDIVSIGVLIASSVLTALDGLFPEP